MNALLEQPPLPSASPAQQFAAEREALISVGRMLHGRGWSLATSSNYSIVLDREPLALLLTASGKHKGALKPTDFVLVDEAARAIDPIDARPSAEALLHCEIARLPGVGAILHTHSVWGTVLSDVHFAAGALAIEGYEMLKGIDGITTHEQRLEIPIFENTQDIPTLAAELRERNSERRTKPMQAFLIRRHGLYTWGKTIDDARRHVEAIEFLFEVVAQRRLIDGHR